MFIHVYRQSKYMIQNVQSVRYVSSSGDSLFDYMQNNKAIY